MHLCLRLTGRSRQHVFQDDEIRMEERGPTHFVQDGPGVSQDGSMDQDMSPAEAPSGSRENGPAGAGHVSSPQDQPANDEAIHEPTSMIESLVNAPGPTDEVSKMRHWALAMGFSDENVKRVVELFSPPRVNAALSRKKGCLIPGHSFDLIRDPTTGESWDLLRASDRRKCWQILEEQRPWLVIGSPPCTYFSVINQGLNYPKMDPREVARRGAEGRALLGFSLQVYRWQVERGAYFLR